MRRLLLILFMILTYVTSCTYYHGFSQKDSEKEEMYFGNDTITVTFSARRTKWPGRPGKFEANFYVNGWGKESWPKDSIVFDSVCLSSNGTNFEKCVNTRGQGVSSTYLYVVEFDYMSIPKIDSFVLSFHAVAYDRASRKELRRERFTRILSYYKRTRWFEHAM